MRNVWIALVALMFCCQAAGAVGQPGLTKGETAPDFTAPNHEGESVSLYGTLKKGPVVLIFYRGGWCMYCNRQLQDYQDHLDEFKEHGARIIAVSVDKIEYANQTVEEKELGFEVISNPEADILEAYQLTYHVPEDLAKKYKDEYGIDLVAASGREDYLIAVPATYVIGTDGTILYAYANEDYKVRPDINEVLDALEGM